MSLWDNIFHSVCHHCGIKYSLYGSNLIWLGQNLNLVGIFDSFFFCNMIKSIVVEIIICWCFVIFIAIIVLNCLPWCLDSNEFKVVTWLAIRSHLSTAGLAGYRLQFYFNSIFPRNLSCGTPSWFVASLQPKHFRNLNSTSIDIFCLSETFSFMVFFY